MGDRKAGHETEAAAARAAELLSRMSLEEKARMFAGKDAWHLQDVPRLGVPALEVADCGHGVTLAGDRAARATCFPTSVGMASSWNEELLHDVGRALGRECRALGVSILLGPMVNLHRVPVGGRNYETFSEDPFLTGKLAEALIRGVQEVGTGACIKAAAANNQQKHQYSASVELDERTLRELYLRQFEIAIREASPCAVMTSYNKLRGKDTAADPHLLREIIKGEWGFIGFTVSDWRGVRDTGPLTAGLELEMPGPPKFLTPETVLIAVERGLITESDLDDRVLRLLRAIVAYGPGPDGTSPGGMPGALDTPEHRELARKVAEESIVLLKNAPGRDGRPVLPLESGRIRRLAVIGPNAAHARLGGGGSASVTPFYAVSPLEGLRARFAESAEVVFEEGCALSGTLSPFRGPFTHMGPDGARRPGLLAEYWAGGTEPLADEPPVFSGTVEAVDFSWGWASPAPGVPRPAYVARFSGTYVPARTGTVRLSLSFGEGGARLIVNGKTVIDEWLPGDASFEAAYAAKTVPVEMPMRKGEPLELRVEYRKLARSAYLRLEWEEPGGRDPIARAVELARSADAAVLCVGLSNMFEGGTNDRAELALPGVQNRLIEEVAAANPDTVVVLVNGSPVAMPWLGKAAAVLEAWYPGQEGGNAIARIIAGDVNPSGKLPDTFPVRLEDVEAMANYPGDGKFIPYREGVFVGYRQFVTRGPAPLFPFGFGLSYTTFRYDSLSLSGGTLGPEDSLTVSVEVTNTGTRLGKETVQLYVSAPENGVPRPARELKGFRKLELAPGETKRAVFTLTVRELSYFDETSNRFDAVPGQYRVTAGPDCTGGLEAAFTYGPGDSGNDGRPGPSGSR